MKLPSGDTVAIAVAVAALAVLGGGVAYVAYDRERLRELLRQAAGRLAIPPAWLFGMAKIESNWNASAVNKAGADGERGGAYGLLQITLRTAEGYGYQGAPEGLLDPVRHVALAERIIAARRPQTLAELAAWWNAGRTSLAAAPASTRNTYFPKLQAAAESEA